MVICKQLCETYSSNRYSKWGHELSYGSYVFNKSNDKSQLGADWLDHFLIYYFRYLFLGLACQCCIFYELVLLFTNINVSLEPSSFWQFTVLPHLVGCEHHEDRVSRAKLINGWNEQDRFIYLKAADQQSHAFVSRDIFKVSTVGKAPKIDDSYI